MRIAVVDCETTGRDPEADAVCEVAMVELIRLSDASWIAGPAVSSLSDPGRPMPAEARAVHHISDEQLRGAPRLSEALRLVMPLGDGRAPDFYAAHNAAFDRGFLGRGLGPAPWICTWRCSLHLWPDAPRHSNQVLRYWLGLDADTDGLSPHRAGADAIVTAAVLRRMLDENSPEELLRLTSAPALLTSVRFGKHRGLRWSELPPSYLSWILRQTGPSAFDADVRHTARHHLELSGHL